MDKHFGKLYSTSDGWRAVIGDAFTFDNIRRLTFAIGKYLQLLEIKRPRALVAFDTRFMGNIFAEEIVGVLMNQGIECDMVGRPIPTPLLSWVVYQAYNIGLMVTASHNPPYYNGLKIRMPYGGPPDENTMRKIEELIIDIPPETAKIKDTNTINPWNDYIDAIRNKLDLSLIDNAAPIIAVDSMHGVTAGLLKDILSGTSAKVIQVRSEPDPLFGGISPEPKLDTVLPLIEEVKRSDCVIGVAHDGDGDRIVAVDPTYGYLSPHDLLTLLSFDLVRRKGLSGSIVASVSTTRRIRKAAKFLERVFHEVPIGFRNACELMRAEKVLVAGEENGGIGIGSHLPERDGTLIAALLVEMISDRKKGPGEYLLELENIVGKASFMRRDIKVNRPAKEAVDSFTSNLPHYIADYKILEHSTIDGVKLFLEKGSWVLIRAAGTEPLIRIYAEADDVLMCESIIGAVFDHLSKC